MHEAGFRDGRMFHVARFGFRDYQPLPPTCSSCKMLILSDEKTTRFACEHIFHAPCVNDNNCPLEGCDSHPQEHRIEIQALLNPSRCPCSPATLAKIALIIGMLAGLSVLGWYLNRTYH
ncbi:MAG: hypothetical protein JSS32_06900 [Verrucomicrobia bacterium]|nr:hypothetical protein [Verrucomicrobiota bacterium]